VILLAVSYLRLARRLRQEVHDQIALRGELRMKRSLLTGVFVLLLSAVFAFAQTPSQDKGQNPPQNPSPTNANNPAQPQNQNPDMQAAPGAQSVAPQDKGATSAAATDDDTLKRQVKEQLSSNPDLANVQVEVAKGKVTLTGSVPKKEDRSQAKDLARAVPGVKSVSEHLSIAAASSSTASSAAGTTAGANLPQPAEETSHAGAGNAASLPQASEQPKGESANLPSASNPSSASNSTGTAAAGAGAATTSQANANPSSQPATAAPETSPKPQAPAATVGKPSIPAGTGEATQSSAQASTANQPSAQTETRAGAGSNLPQSSNSQTSAQSSTSTSTQAGASSNLPQSSTTETGARAGMNNDSAQLQSQIQQALQNESTLSNASINVNVTEDTIEISGSVPTGKDRQTAKRIAQSFAGNRRVVDHLTVSGKDSKTPTSNPNQNPNTNPKSQGDQTSNPR
jgi:osmotically-inducible protein OsmY